MANRTSPKWATNSDFSSVHNILLQYLNESKETDFIKLFSTSKIYMNTEDDKEATSVLYLEIACDNNLLSVVQCLIRTGVDINETTEENKKPIWIVASKGFHKIFELLIKEKNIIIDNDVLPEILKKLDFQWNNNQSDYNLCLKYFLKYKPQYVNMKNKDGNYPLLYAARHGGSDIVLELLRKNASLANRNKNGNLVIDKIDYETLKEHFDSCIEDIFINNYDKGNAAIRFNYANIMPSVVNEENGSELDVEKSLNSTRNVRTGREMEAVLWMSESSELKPLLIHPLITSMLYLKWARIRWLYFMNIMTYITFCSFLMFHSISLSKGFKDYQSLSYYFLFCMSIVFYIRELFQFYIGPIKYLKNFENYLELGLLSTVAYMLYQRYPNKDLSNNDVNEVSAIAVIFAAFSFEFLVGKHPAFSKHIVMLRRVAFNFFKCLLFYLIPIIAFTFSFYILFDDASFKAPFTALFKTIIMIAGEYNTNDVNFDRYPTTSRLIFLVFVITIAVILLNLLNGLAVSDIQIIKSEAELVDQICRAEFIAYSESLIFSFLDIINYISCASNSKVRKTVNFNFFAKGMCLLPNCLEEDGLTVDCNGKVTFLNGKHVYLDKDCVREATRIINERKKINTLNKIKVHADSRQPSQN